jgi:hypothetical protein
MQQFRPDIKPPCWGPLDAIRFAVRANCEKLGLNYAAIDGYWPLLERGGDSAVDVVNESTLSITGAAAWTPHGVRVNNTTNSAIQGLSQQVNKAATAQTTLVWLHDITTLYFSEGALFANRNAYNDAQGFALDTSSSKLRFRHQTAGGRFDIFSTVDIRGGVGPVVYKHNTPMLFGCAYGPGSCSFYLDAKNIPADVVSHTSTGITASNRSFFIGNSFNNSVNTLTVAAAIVSHEKISDDVVIRLAFEPYTLLMPVARPLYFDLGASAGTDSLTASDLVVGSPVLGTPALGQVHALIATGITTPSPVLDTPALGQVHGLAVTALTVSAPVLGTPAVGQAHSLVASALVVGSPVLDTPTLSENAPDVDALTAVDLVVGSPVLGTPAIGQVHSLTAVNLSVASPALGTPSLEIGTDNLVANSLVVGSPVLGTPSLGQIHVLGSDGLVTGPPVLGSPAITQIHTIEALGLTVGAPVIGTPAINGSDIVLITAAEVARVVSASSRMKTVTASQRVKQVRYEIARA